MSNTDILKPQLLLKAGDPNFVYYDPLTVARGQQLLRLLDKKNEILSQLRKLDQELCNIDYSLYKYQLESPETYRWRLNNPKFPNSY